MRAFLRRTHDDEAGLAEMLGRQGQRFVLEKFNRNLQAEDYAAYLERLTSGLPVLTYRET